MSEKYTYHLGFRLALECGLRLGEIVGLSKQDYHFQRVVKEAQVPVIRFHDLRHTFASWYMIEVGDIWSLKGILGHVDIQTTQRYAHLSQSHQKVPNLKWSSEKNENFSRHFHATFRESSKKAI